MQPELAIVVPVYNEADNILPLAQEVAKAVAEAVNSYELVFIDDGSTDSTWLKIREAHEVNRCVRGVRHLTNAGQSAALWTGLQSTGSALIGTLDGDLQNNPADLPKLLKELEQVDFVCGVRTKRQDAPLRRISSQVARAARKWVLGVDFADTGCALRVFKREIVGNVLPFNGMHRFLPILVHSSGYRTREVPISHRPRIAGVSKYGIGNRLFRGILDLFAVAWYQKRRMKPIEIETLGDQPNPTEPPTSPSRR